MHEHPGNPTVAPRQPHHGRASPPGPVLSSFSRPCLHCPSQSTLVWQCGCLGSRCYQGDVAGWRRVLEQGVWLLQPHSLLAGTLHPQGGKRNQMDRAWAPETHWPWTHVTNTWPESFSPGVRGHPSHVAVTDCCPKIKGALPTPPRLLQKNKTS